MSSGFIQVQEPAGTPWPGTTVVPATGGTATPTNAIWSSLADSSGSNSSIYNLEVHRDYPGVCSSGAPASGGRTEMSDFEIVKYPDQMTPKFFEKCVTGGTIKHIIVEMDTHDGTMVYVLTDNNISSHNVIGPSRFQPNQLEIIKVIYTKIQVFAQSGFDYSWNVQTNNNTIPAGDKCSVPLPVDPNRLTRKYLFS